MFARGGAGVAVFEEESKARCFLFSNEILRGARCWSCNGHARDVAGHAPADDIDHGHPGSGEAKGDSRGEKGKGFQRREGDATLTPSDTRNTNDNI